jgi:hypothetical protein
MTKLFPVNRVVLILHAAFVVATAAVVFVAALQGSLPHAWQPAAALAATVLGGLAAASATTIKFLDGSQKSEALQAAPPVPEQLDPQTWLHIRQSLPAAASQEAQIADAVDASQPEAAT